MFWLIAAVLTLAAILFLLPSLFSKKHSHGKSTGDKPLSSESIRLQQNILIAKEQLEDIEFRFEKGELSEEAYRKSRQELEQSLYDDLKQSEQQEQEMPVKRTPATLISSAIIVSLVPLIAVGMYLKLGNPVFTTELSSKQAARQELRKNVPTKADGSPDIDTMVAGLQKKMEADPDNLKGWFMLGRSYMVLRKYPEAATAFERANKLQPDSTEIMLALADSLAMKNGGRIEGQAVELIDKVLAIEPNNLTGLWLGGMAARQQLDFVTAVKRWQHVLPQLRTQEEKTEINSLIAEAKKQLTPEQQAQLNSNSQTVEKSTASTSQNQKVADSAASQSADIVVSITLADKFKSSVQPEDYVFVYAKAMNGPPMPLAAVKKQVKDLPFEVKLNDEMAMMPNLKVSSFPQVVVGARVSKTGGAISQNGDLYTEQSAVKAGDAVALKIDSVLSK